VEAEGVGQQPFLAVTLISQHVQWTVTRPQFHNAGPFDFTAGLQFIERELGDRRAGKGADDVVFTFVRVRHKRLNRCFGFPPFVCDMIGFRAVDVGGSSMR